MFYILVDIQQQMLVKKKQKQASQPHGVHKQLLVTQKALIQTRIEEPFRARTLTIPTKASLILFTSKLEIIHNFIKKKTFKNP